MTAGRPQLHVAIALFNTVRPCGVRVRGCRSRAITPYQLSRRWQSTATKGISTPNGSQHTSHRNEIPADCFTELSVFPSPTLSRTEHPQKLDLSSTRPAPIDSPTPLERRDYPDGNIPVGDRAKYLFKLGKSFLSFYKTGLKNVWANYKQYRSIRARFQGQSIGIISKYGGQSIDGKTVPQISRSEYQLCLRSRHDVFKMIPFSLVFIICGEFTPLVIIALGSSIVPYTCRIPRQEEKDLETKVKQDRNYMEDLQRTHPELETGLETPTWLMEHLEAYRLGLTSFRTPMPVIGFLYHSMFTRPRLTRHCNNIVADTLLIHREGGAYSLSHQDLYEWADAYGLYALRKYVEQCKTSGQDPRNERLKTELLPKIDAEIKYMLNEVADWSRLKPNEQWRVGLRTVGSRSPDWQARVKDIRNQWKQA